MIKVHQPVIQRPTTSKAVGESTKVFLVCEHFPLDVPKKSYRADGQLQGVY